MRLTEAMPVSDLMIGNATVTPLMSTLEAALDATANPPAPSPVERFRPVDWTTWLLWVTVAAAGPILSTIAATALQVELPRDDPQRLWTVNSILAVLAVTLLAPPLLQGFVLKRIALRFSIGFWFACVVFSVIIWFVLTQTYIGLVSIVDAPMRAQNQFAQALLRERFAAPLSWSSIAALPWGPLLLWTLAISAATSLLPAWAIGNATGRRGDTLMFFAAALIAACAATVADQTYAVYGYPRPFGNQWALNNMPWPERFQLLATRSGAGAVWGATSAFVVVLFTRRLAAANTRLLATNRPAGLAAMLAALVGIAILAPFAGYLAGPQGVRAGAPAFRKALTVAPDKDTSTDDAVLTYSHNIELALARYAAIAIAPDSHTVIVRSAEHKLTRIDLATGRAIAPIADALAPLERHAVVWSPDGRFVALRSNGDQVAIPNSRYSRNQSRLRIYALPDFTLAGEFINREGYCFDSYSREPMLFAPDGNSIWLTCAQHTTPKSDDLMALRLSLPSLQVLDTRRYGNTAASGELRGLERVGDSIWGWQFPSAGAEPLRIRDLANDREVLALTMPAGLIGNLTAQGVTEINDKTVKLVFCGVLSNDPKAAELPFDRNASLCRTLTFDSKTGSLLDQNDRADVRFATPSATLTGHGLRVESTWQQNSKAGETLVRDAATGKERQRIVSVSQRPLALSPDSHWLVMLDIDRNALRIYRVTP